MNKLDLITKSFGPLRVRKDEPMRFHTNNRIGGPADVYLETMTTDELVKIVRLCIELKVPYVVLGGATNVLVADRGIRGVVIKHRASAWKILGYKGKIHHGRKDIGDILIEVESGMPMGHLVRSTIEESLAGLESFLGLPGTVGGAVYNNSHFQRHGAFFGDHVSAATVLDQDGKVKKISHKEFAFGYDDSRLQHTKEILLTVTLQLKKGEKEKLWVKANEASREIRLREQPYQTPSHGCTFRNITHEQAFHAKVPGRTQSVGALVDACGLKGRRIGNAEISDQHANFIVNCGKATADDVLKLMQLMRSKIKEKFGLVIKPEIFLIGEFTKEERAKISD